MMRKQLLMLPVLMLSAAAASAQGCSDAGFCSIGSMKHESTAGQQKNKLSLVLANGIGDESVYIFTPALQYEHQFSSSFSIQTKLTANYASGNLGSAAGPGDIVLAGIKNTLMPHGWQAAYNLAVKIPLHGGNLTKDGKALPMQYQSSLGTVDIIAGITVSNKRWAFSAGWQQPLTGTTGNQFLPAYWGSNQAAYKYLPGNDFNRKGDILLKAGYNFFAGKWKLNTGLLGIYHLGNDTYIDGNISNKPIALTGSAGTTLNATVSAWYSSNNKISFGIAAGTPFIVRKIRPDGLTRQFVIAPEISISF